MNEIKKSWKGEEKLWKVFWIYNFLLGGLINIGIGQTEKLEAEYMLWFLIIVTLIWVVWVSVSLWRCAFNASWKGWGYIVRGFLVLSLVIGCLAIFGFVEVE